VFGAAAAAAPVQGLIVQLRDAPAHELLADPRAQALGGEDLAVVEQRRWQSVLAASGVAADAHRPPALRGVGRSARLIEFAPALSAAEVQRHLQRLRALPEVEWAVANEREQRLQNTTPSDPMFGGALGRTSNY
jgi:hypothetical protein